MKTTTKLAVLAAAMALVASCTMKEQEAPPLTGPSEFGTALNITVTPDVLQQDGASQSVVRVLVSGPSGQPLAGVPLRVETRVNGQAVDFGSLSARSVVTGPDGRATLIYTAPRVSADVESLVEIVVTPIGSNFQNATARSATIRLVPTGVVLPPSNLVPAFSFTPINPAQGQTVVFDAQESRGSIAEYRWDFGDGRTATGQMATHAYGDVGTYVVRLTLVDTSGRTSSVSRSISVGQSAAPVAQFSFSPADPRPNDDVRFNAAASTPAAGRSIVSYVWDFGDGTTATGQQVSRRFTAPRTYNVTLTVTDDIGRTSVITKPVNVASPDDDGG